MPCICSRYSFVPTTGTLQTLTEMWMVYWVLQHSQLWLHSTAYTDLAACWARRAGIPCSVLPPSCTLHPLSPSESLISQLTPLYQSKQQNKIQILARQPSWQQGPNKHDREGRNMQPDRCFPPHLGVRILIPLHCLSVCILSLLSHKLHRKREMVSQNIQRWKGSTRIWLIASSSCSFTFNF